jgi:transposase
MSTPSQLLVGIDVSKDHLDLALRQDERSWQFANSLEGLDALADLLKKREPNLIVLEATGGYEQLALHQLRPTFPVAIVNPRRVRAFARANGPLATPALAGGARETDRIDAHNLAHLAQVIQPHPQPPSSEAQKQLAGMIARRRHR